MPGFRCSKTRSRFLSYRKETKRLAIGLSIAFAKDLSQEKPKKIKTENEHTNGREAKH